MKVIVVGGGPAGMMSAICAANGGADVILLEKNEKLGKKLYISGKGRCNVTNKCAPKEFLENVVTNPKFLFGAVGKFAPSDTMEMLENSGLTLKTERGNRVFPESDKSSDVIKTFQKMLAQSGVKVLLNRTVLSISKQNDVFDVKTDVENFSADKVIVATGGVTYRATGSTGDGYAFAKAFDHDVIPPKPALCRLLCKGTKSLEGLSLKNVSVSLVDSLGKTVASEFGEMLFTDDGVSGPAVLSLSSKINRFNGKNARIVIDLKPALDEKTLDERILRDFAERMNKNFGNALDGLLPERLIACVIAQSGVSPFKKVNVVTAVERKSLCNALKNLSFDYVGLGELDGGIVTSGGVDVKEVSPSTMQSKLVSGLYFAGEVLDVDALTGGFNIQIALSTGFVAGSSAVKE